jgi:uncharacterized Fe-S cluster protein YjdI
MMSTSERTGAGDAVIFDAEGNLLRQGGTWCLCRCGGSRNKPFGDITHGLKGFDGSESADHRAIADRRDSYPADGVTVYDDRTVCAHFGQCTSRLPAVFRADAEPFVHPHEAQTSTITDVVTGCPSKCGRFARAPAAWPGRAAGDRRPRPRASALPPGDRRSRQRRVLRTVRVPVRRPGFRGHPGRSHPDHHAPSNPIANRHQPEVDPFMHDNFGVETNTPFGAAAAHRGRSLGTGRPKGWSSAARRSHAR